MRRNDNEIKFNGIVLWSKSNDWGQKAISADKKVLMNEITPKQNDNSVWEGTDFNIEAYIYGPDTSEKISKLQQAFINNKSGILEHKDLGEVRVKFTGDGFRFRRSESKHDYAEVSLHLTVSNEASLNIKIVEVLELKAELLLQLEAKAHFSFLADFNAGFKFEGLPNLVKIQTFENLSQIVTKLSKITTDNLIGEINAKFDASWEISASLEGGIGASFQAGLEFEGSAKNKFQAYLDLAKFNPEFKDAEISAHAQIEENTKTTINLIQQTAIIKACEQIKEEAFTTKSEINAAIKEIAKASEAIALNAQSREVQNNVLETVHLALVILKSLKALNTHSIVNNVNLPTAVICHTQQCREEDFIKNNQIRHPLFVESGIKLEISNDRN